MKRTVVLIVVMMFFTTTGLSAPLGNYLGIMDTNASLTIKEFDAAVPTSSAGEFVKVSADGGIRPRNFLALAMQSGWEVAFDETGIKSNALLVFHNPEKNSSVLAIVQRDGGQLKVRWHTDDTAHNQTFTSIEKIEKQFDHPFIGAVNPSKHKLRWGSTALYSSYYETSHLSYAFRLYDKYSGRLRLQQDERGHNGIMYALVERGMPYTKRANQIKTGSMVFMTTRGRPASENGWIMFVTHVDSKNELVYYTYLGPKNSPIIKVETFDELQSRMKTAILPERIVASPILF